MRPTSNSTEPLILFGDLDQDLWGVAIGEPPTRWMVASFDGGPLAAIEPLSISDTEATSRTENADDVLQLVRIEGDVDHDGARRHVELPGCRVAALTADKLGSLRLLGAWLSDGRQLALSAWRHRGANGHDHDDVQALTTGGDAQVIIDPRLSTTYDQHDAPRRVGIELWLVHDDEDSQHSQRFAGEAAGSSLSDTDGALRLDAYGLRCWDNDESGTGVYILIRSDSR